MQVKLRKHSSAVADSYPHGQCRSTAGSSKRKQNLAQPFVGIDLGQKRCSIASSYDSGNLTAPPPITSRTIQIPQRGWIGFPTQIANQNLGNTKLLD
jgi:hypothetical protein